MGGAPYLCSHNDETPPCVTQRTPIVRRHGFAIDGDVCCPLGMPDDGTANGINGIPNIHDTFAISYINAIVCTTNADPRIRIPQVCQDSNEETRSLIELISPDGLGMSSNLTSNLSMFSSKSSIFSHRWEIRSVSTAIADRLLGIVVITPPRRRRQSNIP